MIAGHVNFRDLDEAVEGAAVGAIYRVAIGETGIEMGCVIEAFPAIGDQVIGVELTDEAGHFGGPAEEGVRVAGIAELIAEFPGKDGGFVAVGDAGDGVDTIDDGTDVVLEPESYLRFGEEECRFAGAGGAAEKPGGVAADTAVGFPVVGEPENETKIAGLGEGNGLIEGNEIGFVVLTGPGLDGGGVEGRIVIVMGVAASDGETEGGHVIEGLFDVRGKSVGDVGLVEIDVVAEEAEGFFVEG